jgi:glutamate formiminotransferase
MSTDSKSFEGVYRNGKIELLETPTDVDEARVIVTFVSEGAINLRERGIDEIAAANLRSRLDTFAEDWDRPEMGAYDAL